MLGGYRRELEDYKRLKSGCVEFRRQETLLKAENVPSSFSLMKSGWKIRNQQFEGSCGGHMLAAAGEMLVKFATGKFPSFSPDFAYYKAQSRCGLLGSDQGTTIDGACEAGMKDGFLPEDMMPYTPEYNPGDITLEMIEVAINTLIKRKSRSGTIEDLRAWIGTGQGCELVGMPWTNNMSRFRGGVIKDLGSVASAPGWHAVLGCGYRDDGSVEIKNSHGIDYGEEGFAVVSERVYNQIRECGSTRILVSDIGETPEPVVRSVVEVVDPFLGT